MPEGTPPADAAPDTGAPPAEPEAPAVDHAAEAEKWKAVARKHEDRAKANANAAKELEALKLSTMDETQQQIEAAKAETRAAVLAEVASQRVADKFEAHGVDAELIDGLNLTKFLTDDGDPDVDAIKAGAEKVAPAAPEATDDTPPGFPPMPDLGQGSRQTVPLGSDPLLDLLKGTVGAK